MIKSTRESIILLAETKFNLIESQKSKTSEAARKHKTTITVAKKQLKAT